MELHLTPRHPQSEGSVERTNGDIKDMLVAWMGDNGSLNNICSFPEEFMLSFWNPAIIVNYTMLPCLDVKPKLT